MLLQVHLIPIPKSPAELTPIPSSERPNVDDAITTVTQYCDVTKASDAVQNAIRSRIRSYPDIWKEQQHFCRVIVPPVVRSIIKTSPQTISAAVRAFYMRDNADLRACR